MFSRSEPLPLYGLGEQRYDVLNESVLLSRLDGDHSTDIAQLKLRKQPVKDLQRLAQLLREFLRRLQTLRKRVSVRNLLN